MQTIPLTQDAGQTLRVTLGGQPVVLRAWWQPLSEAWYLSVRSRSEDPIALGRQVTHGRRLIGAANGFSGELIAVPLRPDGDTVGRDAWGQTHALVYLDGDETAVTPWPR